MKQTRQERVEIANYIIKAVASCGRRFFSMNCDRPGPPDPAARVSRFELVKGRLWYVDKYRENRIYVSCDCRWRSGWSWRFSEGGTLLKLTRHLRDFIVKGTPIKREYFGPFPEWCSGGDPWGYGTDMAVLRSKVDAILGANSDERSDGKKGTAE